MKKILIPIGLPGSGKTFFSTEYTKDNGANHIEVDKCRIAKYGTRSLENIFLLNTENNDYNNVIFDGLFLTNLDIIGVINMIKENTVEENLEYEIHYWNKDIDSCLHNDTGRRELSSEDTIMYAILEDIDLNLIKSKTNIDTISIVYHDVIRKSEIQLIADKSSVNLDEDGCIYSSQWLINGEGWNYTGSRWNEEPEAPVEFESFDRVIDNLYPDMPFRKYKELFKECVKEEDINFSGYYECGTRRRYSCDLEDLLKEIEDMR